MNILSACPANCSFSQIECCTCKKTMSIHDSTSYIITKSGYFVCNDCVDNVIEVVRLHKNTNFD